MKACIFHGQQSVSITEVERPSLPEGGAVAKVLVASVCGTDLRSFRFGNPSLEGAVIGHEACMRIEELDDGVTDFHIGDRIIVAPAIGCGVCRSCLRGHSNMCDDLKTIGFQYPGTFAQYVSIPALAFQNGNVIKLPGSLSDEEASVVEPVACAINAQSFLRIQPGDNVLIYGAGYLGCIHAELAVLAGADRVILADVSAPRIAQARRDLKGVTAICSADPDFQQQITDLTDGQGIDVIVTACPVGEVHRQALELINKSGRISLFGGLPGEGAGYLSSNLIHYKEAGVFGAHASTPEQNHLAADLLARGKINVNKYLTVFPLNQAEDAFHALIQEKATKALLSI